MPWYNASIFLNIYMILNRYSHGRPAYCEVLVILPCNTISIVRAITYVMRYLNSSVGKPSPRNCFFIST